MLVFARAGACFAGLMSLFVSALAQPLSLSLTDVWARSDAYSKAIQMKTLEVDKSRAAVKDAVVERLPDLSVGGNYEKATNIPIYDNGLFQAPTQHEVIHTLYKIGTDAYLNVYNGNKTNLKIAEEKVKDKIAVEEEHSTVSDIRLRAAARYLELQRSLIFKDLVTKDITDQEAQLEQIRQFHKNGVVLKSDVLRVELKLSKEKLSLVTIVNDIDLATQKLNILMGTPDAQPVIPTDRVETDSIPLRSYEECLAEALEQSFSYRISAQETRLKEIELRDVKANVSFKVGLYGDFYYANPQIFLYPYNPHLYSLGLGGVRASFPLSSFYLNRQKEKIAALELKRQEVEHADTEDNVRKAVREAYLRYQEALVGVGVARVNVAQSEENARIVTNAYFNQTVLVTDLLDANVQLLQSRLDLATARIKAHLQYCQLQNVIGVL